VTAGRVEAGEAIGAVGPKAVGPSTALLRGATTGRGELPEGPEPTGAFGGAGAGPPTACRPLGAADEAGAVERCTAIPAGAGEVRAAGPAAAGVGAADGAVPDAAAGPVRRSGAACAAAGRRTSAPGAGRKAVRTGRAETNGLTGGGDCRTDGAGAA
jgi:hypothetical protein